MKAWKPRANDIFLRAAEIHAPDGRRRYVDDACGGDADLKAEVESLIAAGERAGGFLDSPPLGLEPGIVPEVVAALEATGGGDASPLEAATCHRWERILRCLAAISRSSSRAEESTIPDTSPLSIATSDDQALDSAEVDELTEFDQPFAGGG